MGVVEDARWIVYSVISSGILVMVARFDISIAELVKLSLFSIMVSLKYVFTKVIQKSKLSGWQRKTKGILNSAIKEK